MLMNHSAKYNLMVKKIFCENHINCEIIFNHNICEIVQFCVKVRYSHKSNVTKFISQYYFFYSLFILFFAIY